jgi:AraC family transcriptional regulator of adaptative response / DNA-3-methyladenine glycosylase II
MELDLQSYERARLSRDARFDGRFFIGVTTTGVYCRPICPAPSPKPKNVRYFPSAAAAAEAGYRPCLRCRPESSPGTPAWLGTSSTVSRALRLLADGTLEDAGIEDLAGRLGIGSRHLRRLFLQHLGATPIAVAQTRRLHFAKRLIDDTDLPFAEIAGASGFGSIRRFNATFRTLYGRSPTEIRRLGSRGRKSEPGRYCFQLGFRPPFDWEGLLEFLGPRALPGVEIVEGDRYRRTFQFGARWGHLEARRQGDALEVRIAFPEARSLVTILERVRFLFDLGADPQAIRSQLGADAVLAARVAARPGLRVPGAWDGFEIAVRAILGQQVTVKGATTLAGRLVRDFGRKVDAPGGLSHLFPTPRVLARADLSRIGLPRARAESIRQLAHAVETGAVEFTRGADPEAFELSLTALPGIGPWTAQYVALRTLGEPDAFPCGDLGLRKAAGRKTPKDLERLAESWRPWRAYAALHLWQGGNTHGNHAIHARRKPDRSARARRR